MASDGVIYDFGMNNGDDVAYYLRKGRKVVGVEANPALVAQCAARFAEDVAAGRLKLVNAALATRDDTTPQPFYIHRGNHLLSRLTPPAPADAGEFEPIMIPQARAATLIAQHGRPHYVKIDLEGFDATVLRDLFGAGLRPDFISVEAHTKEPLQLLIDAGYAAFALTDGAAVAHRYADARIATPRGAERYAFPVHSAGPFGEDLRTAWRAPAAFERRMSRQGFGWKDIHATNCIAPDGAAGLIRGLLFVARQDARHFARRAVAALRRRAQRLLFWTGA